MPSIRAHAMLSVAAPAARRVHAAVFGRNGSVNAQTTWRRALARRLAVQLQHFGAVQAIAVIGSVAYGYADAYSDLELLVLWEQPPDAALRHAVMRHLGAELREPARLPIQDYALLVGGVAVDLWHTTPAEEAAWIATVLHEHSLDLVANNRLAVIASSLPLYGAPVLQHLKQRVAAYPDALALRFLDTYLPHFYLRHLNLAARRDNPTSFFHLLSDIQCSLFVGLLALNNVYFPTYKWIYPILDELALTPPTIGDRLRGMFVVPPPQAAAELRAVLSETLDLVEAQYPQFNTATIRYGLEQPPHRYDVPDAA